MATKDIKININGKYSAKGAYDQAVKDNDRLQKSVSKTDSHLKKGSNSMGAFGSKSANTSGKLKGLGQALGQFNPQLGNMASKTGGASGALAALGGSMGLVAGAAVAAGAAIVAFGVMSYQKAVTSQAEWAKFKGVVESAGQSFDNSKQIVKDFAMTSGVSIASVRTSFQQLTSAGINPSGEALKGVHELSLGLRTSMESAATAYTRIVKGGQGAQRTLTKLGITMEEISTGGKVDTAKLNAILEQKFGKAGDNYANSAEAAGIRLQTSIDGIMVAFGNVFLGPGTAIQNALAWLISGLTSFGGWLFDAFGGGNAFSGAMDFLTPVIDELSSAMGDLMAEIFPNTKATGQLKPIITALGAILAAFIRPIVMAIRVTAMLINAVKTAGTYITKAGQVVWGAGAYLQGAFRNTGKFFTTLGSRIWSIINGAASYLVGAFRGTASWFRGLGGRVWSYISGGISSFASSVRSAGQSLYSAIRGAPGLIYSAIVNALPRIQWPTWNQIAGWIRNMIFGSRGPGMGIGSIGSYTQQQRDKLRATYLQNQQATSVLGTGGATLGETASQVNKDMGVFGYGPRGPSNWKQNVAGMTYAYQDYGGSRQKAWDGSSDCMTGNCVDMSLGVLNLAAASGAKNLGLAQGTWNGGPHVWAVVDGVSVDPARKALNGTFAPPARGPGGSGGVTVVLAGPVYGYDDFVKKVQQANDKSVSRVF